jgi:hypothetical protein
MSRLARTAALAFLIGGAAWAIDVAVIIAVDGSFDPLDSFLFFSGLVANLAAVVLLVAWAARGQRGARRLLAAACAVIALAGGLAAISLAGDQLARALYSGSNAGGDEGSVLAVAIVALLVGYVLRREPVSPV